MEEEEGGPNKRVPQRSLAGSNPAWAPVQQEETSRSRVRERRREAYKQAEVK